jgi:hypothetical protein
MDIKYLNIIFLYLDIIRMSTNKWVNFVKQFSKDNNLSYACALSTPECKDSYRAKYGVSKKLTKKQNLEKMGAEDMDAPNIKLVVKEKKKRKPKELVIEEEPIMEIEVKAKPKKVKVVPVYNEATDDMSKREEILKSFNIKTLKDFLETQHNFKETNKLTKNDTIRYIMLIEAGLSPK